MRGLVLSLFPGLDVLGHGFELEGWCVVRGPDPLFGLGDIRDFSPPAGHITGVVGGPPCQDFSQARRSEPTGEGAELVAQAVRVVAAVSPDWFLFENVPRCPDIRVSGYSYQRLDVCANEFGLPSRRLRHFHFGSRRGVTLALDRPGTVTVTQPAALASEGSRGRRRRSWADFCALQGLPPVELPSLTLGARYRVVGNAVPLPIARAFAAAIAACASASCPRRVCICGCGRGVTRRRTLANAACRKRVSRRRQIGVLA